MALRILLGAAVLLVMAAGSARAQPARQSIHANHLSALVLHPADVPASIRHFKYQGQPDTAGGIAAVTDLLRRLKKTDFTTHGFMDAYVAAFATLHPGHGIALVNDELAEFRTVAGAHWFFALAANHWTKSSKYIVYHSRTDAQIGDERAILNGTINGSGVIESLVRRGRYFSLVELFAGPMPRGADAIAESLLKAADARLRKTH